jgi:hypothetical protein
MANVSEGDSPSLHIVLERIEPARNIVNRPGFAGGCFV